MTVTEAHILSESAQDRLNKKPKQKDPLKTRTAKNNKQTKHTKHHKQENDVVFHCSRDFIDVMLFPGLSVQIFHCFFN